MLRLSVKSNYKTAEQKQNKKKNETFEQTNMALESIRYSNGKLEILDQLLLPAQNKYVKVNGVEDGWKVINRMQVRGAPAIAIVGCLSLAVEIFSEQFGDKKSLRQEIEGKLNYLVSARPTAVNVRTNKYYLNSNYYILPNY